MWIIVSEPHGCNEIRRVADEPHICAVVRRSGFPRDHSACAPVSNGTTCSIIDYCAQHRCQLVRIARVEHSLERSGFSAVQDFSVERINSSYEAWSDSEASVREWCVGAHQLDRSYVERAKCNGG